MKRDRVLLPLLILCAVGARMFVAARTIAPDRDAANYLAMARSFRGGDWAQALAEVFPPLWPLLWGGVGPVGGADSLAWWQGAVLSGALLGGLTVAFGYLAARRWLGFVPALVAGLWLALSVEAARGVADCLSESLFTLLAALWLLAWTRPRGPAIAGAAACAGLAFLCRSEGALLGVPVLVAAWGRRPRARSLAALGLGLGPAVLYLALRAQATGRLVLLPVADLMAQPISVEGEPLSAFGEGSLGAGLAHVLHEGLVFALQGFEGLGWMALPLLPLGLLLLTKAPLAELLAGVGPQSDGPEPVARPRWTILAPALVAVAGLCIVPFFFAHRRFWVAWLPLLLPVAALPLATLRVRPPGQRVVLAALVLSLLPSLVQLWPLRRETLRAERELGLWLARRPEAPAGLACDLKRLHFFAGTEPPPPRHVPGAELMGWAATPGARWVIGYRHHAKLDPEALSALGYRPADLPGPLRDRVEPAGLLVFRR